MNRTGSKVDSVVRALATAMAGAVAFSLLQLGSPSNAAAAPLIPDIDSLIDDSGPLPASPDDLNAVPTLWFSTATGLLCKEQTVKVTHQVACAGDLPGQPMGAHIVDLQGFTTGALDPPGSLPKPLKSSSVKPAARRLSCFRKVTRSCSGASRPRGLLCAACRRQRTWSVSLKRHKKSALTQAHRLLTVS